MKLNCYPISNGPHSVTLLAFLLTLALSPMVHSHGADTQGLGHNCQRPTRPGDEVPPAVWHQFLADVDNFRDCTHRAMEQHQAAASAHQDAARIAVDEWNLFVRHSLNAPEDFPHEKHKHSRSLSGGVYEGTSGGIMGADPRAELKPQFDAPVRDGSRLTIRRKSEAAQ
ncbi:MAG: hypothetical protein ACR2PZ_23410 [Pseudomonadales bacterium]